MPLAHRSQQLKLDTIRPILIFYSHALDSTTGLARLLPLEQPKARILKEYLSSTPPYKKITWMQSWTIVCRWRSVWKAHGAVEHPMISVTEFHCVLWCVDWGTPVLTSVVFWTSARPACERRAAPPATTAINCMYKLQIRGYLMQSSWPCHIRRNVIKLASSLAPKNTKVPTCPIIITEARESYLKKYVWSVA